MELPKDYRPVKLKVVGNTSEDELINHIQHSMTLDLPWVTQKPEHKSHAVIVGGGPSLIEHLDEIKFRAENGQKIFALNNTVGILRGHSIEPDFHIMLDARQSNVNFIPDDQRNIKCYYASLCHPDVLEFADVLWHPLIDGIQDFVDTETFVGGGTSVGTRAICVAYLKGFRFIHLYGFDSSYRGDSHHAYAQPLNDNERVIDVWLAGKNFKCAAWMATQAEEFRDLMPQLMEFGCTITIHGDGLIPHLARQLNTPETILTAVFDLACSPPTYDFLTFLCSAEKARIDGGYSGIDIVFQPGPKGGFRDDNLPPDIQTRKEMLHRICVPACRLLPSVKSVIVLGERTPLEASFPVGWTLDNPVSHYGCAWVKSVPHVLTATNNAKLKAKREKPYITITLRECEYWPERNSNIPEWEIAAKEIESMGYEVVWIRDTSKTLDIFAWDIDLRLALYQGAVCNLIVSNGPADLLRLSDAPYLIFKPITPSCPSTSIEFLNANSIKEGDQFGDNGKMIWDDDKSSVIIAEFKQFITQET